MTTDHTYESDIYDNLVAWLGGEAYAQNLFTELGNEKSNMLADYFARVTTDSQFAVLDAESKSGMISAYIGTLRDNEGSFNQVRTLQAENTTLLEQYNDAVLDIGDLETAYDDAYSEGHSVGYALGYGEGYAAAKAGEEAPE